MPQQHLSGTLSAAATAPSFGNMQLLGAPNYTTCSEPNQYTDSCSRQNGRNPAKTTTPEICRKHHEMWPTQAELSDLKS